MSDIQKEIRTYAKKLLDDKKVELVIGYQDEPDPMATSPCFISNAAEIDKLVWNQFCGNNLAKFLKGQNGKTAIVAKSCDIRSIVVLINEKQIERKNLIIIGVHCAGVIDQNKVLLAMNGRDIIDVEIKGDELAVKADELEKTLKISDCLHDSCGASQCDLPDICDVVFGEKPAEKTKIDKYEKIKQLEQMTAAERWEFFKKELSKCIRCHACRNACPLCYCKKCFVDQSFDAWLGQSTELSDVMCFHIMRAMHTAGRCIDCGACTRACPNQIDLRLLTQKTEKDVKELFGSEAGFDPDDKAPMISYKQDDPQDFIK